MSPIELLLGLVIVFGPVVGFIPQYQQIRVSRDAAGFSTLLCFILIAANIMRVFFWILQHFETTFLLQSLVMIVAQLLLLELIVRVQLHGKRTKDPSPNYDVTRGFSMERFWKWDYFGEYISFLSTFVLAVGSLAFVNLWVLHSRVITECIGFAALMTEATLGMPQLYHNWKSHSRGGLRKELIAAWLVGDIFKSAYFVGRGAPIQFIVCGAIQLLVDVGILLQMLIYPAGPDSGIPHLQPSRVPHFDAILPAARTEGGHAEDDYLEIEEVRGASLLKQGERRATIETAALLREPPKSMVRAPFGDSSFATSSNKLYETL